MVRGAWWATVHGVTKSQTRLKQFSMHACMCPPPPPNPSLIHLGAHESHIFKSFKDFLHQALWLLL